LLGDKPIERGIEVDPVLIWLVGQGCRREQLNARLPAKRGTISKKVMSFTVTADNPHAPRVYRGYARGRTAAILES
jgi:hypothetical protein